MSNRARKMRRLNGHTVARTATASRPNTRRTIFGSIEWTEDWDRDRHRNVTAILQISDSQALQPRATRAKSLACVRLIHQPLVHLHDGRHVGKRLAERR